MTNVAALSRRILLMSLVLAILCMFFSACGKPSVGVGYTPPFAPITFSIDSNGNISVKAQGEIPTFVGTFSIAASESDKLQPDDTTLYVVIRHKQTDKVVDTIYAIQTQDQDIHVVADGKTVIDIRNHMVRVDVTDGKIKRIVVTGATVVTPTPQPNPIATPVPCGFSILGNCLVPVAPTASVAPTPPSAPTPTPTPKTNIIVRDSLRNIPTIPSYQGSRYCFSVDDGYHDREGGNCSYSLQSYSNITVSVTAKLINGHADGSPSTYGLLVGNSMLFAVTSDGKWFFPSEQYLYTPTSAIHTGVGAANTFKVRMQGSHFELFINGTHVGHYDADAPQSGPVGFECDPAATEVVFSNLLITAN